MSDLQQEIDSLTAEKTAQLTNILVALGSTQKWYIDIITRVLTSLNITILSFSTFISQRSTHLGILLTVLTGKTISQGIEALVKKLKDEVMDLQLASNAAIIAANHTEDGAGPLVHQHPIIASAIANSDEAINTFLGELYEQITGLGSSSESISDIMGTKADIAFDTSRISFDVMALAAQTAQHLSVEAWTLARLEQAETATLAAITDITSKYDSMIAARQEMLENEKQFESV